MSEFQGDPKRNSILYWLIAVFLISIWNWFTAPIGIAMIVLKMFSGSRRNRRQQGRHPYYQQQDGQVPAGARTVCQPPAPAEAAPPAPPRPAQVQTPAASKAKKKKVKGQDPIAELDKKGKSWAIAGGATAAGCFVGLTSCLGDCLYWLFRGDIAFFMEELAGPMALVFCIAGGLTALAAGLRKQKQARRYRNYLAMIGRQTSVSISALSSATGLPAGKVREDLSDMLAGGLFPQGFLDYGGDRLVLSGEGIAGPSQQAETPPPPAEDDENAVLAEIRAVNDAIHNEKMSAQIDRIGVITAKILDYQKSHPAKAPQLHSFLSYYLPTTLKILRAYGQLEAQEVAGSNITAAMERIEGMMDKVVEGFEKQLDLLFQGDAMDITADVEVLERMLAKDGLSDQEGITLQL